MRKMKKDKYRLHLNLVMFKQVPEMYIKWN